MPTDTILDEVTVSDAMIDAKYVFYDPHYEEI